MRTDAGDEDDGTFDDRDDIVDELEAWVEVIDRAVADDRVRLGLLSSDVHRAALDEIRRLRSALEVERRLTDRFADAARELSGGHAEECGCRACLPLIAYSDVRHPSRKVFTERSLLEDVTRVWGAYGAHADVLRRLIDRAGL